MTKELENCKQKLVDGGHTCVAQSETELRTDDRRGILPLMQWLSGGEFLRGAVVADKVIGKAAAFLLVLGGVREVFAGVISVPAAEVLENAGISYTFEKKVQNIENRRHDGICPMESAVLKTEDPQEAFLILEKKCAEFQEKKY